MSMEPAPLQSRPCPVDRLVSLPSASARALADAAGARFGGAFVCSDPVGHQIGSGGGTVHLLREAWRARGAGRSFSEWLAGAPKLIVHGSGESRRLPAYACLGKPLLPLPALRGLKTRRPDHTLLDEQFRAYERLLRHAGPAYPVMITCGDVLIEHDGPVPAFPESDVVIFGLAASPEEASHHGVMLAPHDTPMRFDRFLQKPSPADIASCAATHTFYLDTGIWLLSHRALALLLERCACVPSSGATAGAFPAAYDLFATYGPALGTRPQARDEGLNALRATVVPLADARFYHFGTNRSVLASVSALTAPSWEQRSFGHASLDPPAATVVQHAHSALPADTPPRHCWIENADIGPGWRLSERHVVTGIRAPGLRLDLAPGQCLDAVPVPDRGWCLRVYGFDDPFRGRLDAPATVWMGQPFSAWCGARGLTLAAAGLSPEGDIQAAPLFPLVDDPAHEEELLAWMLDPHPAPGAAAARRWLAGPRLSARDLLSAADTGALLEHRRRQWTGEWKALSPDGWATRCVAHDLAVLADAGAAGMLDLPAALPDDPPSLPFMHDSMLRAAFSRRTGAATADTQEQAAFRCLRRLIVADIRRHPAAPRRNVLDDQIVWGRSPIRLDLAGGWTDTPPYCMEHGGRVVNLAADLNGQPPIQVFARLCRQPHIVLRSIDLGVDQTITSYQELASAGELGSGFAIARAALSLAGLEPRFHRHGGHATLARQLEAELGGGIELSMVCAIPKGSGLGTSSILAAAILGTLSELLGLEWTRDDIFRRTMALEQMLTSGGGWQDQVGGFAGGLKLVETGPGLIQRPVLRGLPASFLTSEEASARVLLYYTGLTRIARDILGEIVRGLFLNSSAHISLIEEIGHNAAFVADAIQRHDWPAFCEGIRRSWTLNRLLDAGTDPPPVQAILERVAPWTAAAKLLGAGGGGYLLLVAHDADSARRLRRALENDPPNAGARFVRPDLSLGGFQVTRS